VFTLRSSSGVWLHDTGYFLLMKEILKYISAKHFFADYAKDVRNFTHKMRGVDGNGKAIDFSDEDKKLIASGLKEMMKDTVSKLK